MSNGRFSNCSLLNYRVALMDADDRGEKTAKFWTEFSGYCELERAGRICPIDFRHTKPAIGVSKCGLRTEL